MDADELVIPGIEAEAADSIQAQLAALDDPGLAAAPEPEPIPETSTAPTTFYDRATFLAQRDQLVVDYVERLTANDTDASGDYPLRDRMLAEIYVNGIELRLSLQEFDVMITHGKGLMEGGAGKLFKRLGGK